MEVHKPVGDVMLGLLGCTVVKCDISDGGFQIGLHVAYQTHEPLTLDANMCRENKLVHMCVFNCTLMCERDGTFVFTCSNSL